MLLRIIGFLRRKISSYRTNQILKRLKRCGSDVYISPHCLIWSESCLEIGDNVCIHAFTHIFAGGGLKIGSRTMISSNCSITTVTHPIDVADRSPTICKPVNIGNSVWIGTGAIILPGVSIGDYSVVGAGAVVTKNIPPMQVFVGNPARFLKEVKLDQETTLEYQNEE
jgi:acetyltransferase-like isoleucine patch superfamily enzyme